MRYLESPMMNEPVLNPDWTAQPPSLEEELYGLSARQEVRAEENIRTVCYLDALIRIVYRRMDLDRKEIRTKDGRHILRLSREGVDGWAENGFLISQDALEALIATNYQEILRALRELLTVSPVQASVQV